VLKIAYIDIEAETEKEAVDRLHEHLDNEEDFDREEEEDFGWGSFELVGHSGGETNAYDDNPPEENME